MKRPSRLLLLLAAAIFTTGCGSHEPTEGIDEPAGVRHAPDMEGEREAVAALSDLGANVALDDQGRAKVLRLSGPEVTDATLELVAKLTNLHALYLESTKVTDAGMVHLKPLTKLETLYCVTNTRVKHRALTELKAPTHLEFIHTPLQDVLDTAGEMHAIRIAVNEDDLEAADSPLSVPITAKIADVPLGEALTSMLDPLGLAWTLDSKGLVVTTKDAISQKRPNLAELQKAVPTLKDVLVDW